MVINELKYMTYGLFFVVKISITIDENKINVTNIAIYIHVLINGHEIQCDFNLFSTK